jgi:GTP-binding protein
MFVDRADIHVKAGKGGDGCVSFLREKFRPRGGPDGGDGGRGGSVIVRATAKVATLIDVARRVHYRAEKGQPGRGKHQTGKSGEDLVIEVPLGTLVLDRDTRRLVADLTLEGQELRLARGGRGGKGNASFASATNQTPREHTPGQPGEEGWYTLELKLIADVGLVGLPNAGKSTLVSRVSAARPKIADYPFTTLEPVPGIVSLGEFRSCVFADIPGLIEGAHRGVGLGTEFLRHVERTRMLVHVIDCAPLSGPRPVEAYRQVRDELRLYGGDLAGKPEIVAANKVDLPAAQEGIKELRRALPDREIYPISAATGEGIPALLGAVARRLETIGGAGA